MTFEDIKNVITEIFPNPVRKYVLLVVIVLFVGGGLWIFWVQFVKGNINKTVIIEVSYRGYDKKPNGSLFANGKECENKNKDSNDIDTFECSIPSIGEYYCKYAHGKISLFEKELNASKDFEPIVIDKKTFDITDFNCSLNDSNRFNGKFKLYDADGEKLHNTSNDIKLSICNEYIKDVRVRNDKSIEFDVNWQKFYAMYYDNCKESIDVNVVENDVSISKKVEKPYFFSGAEKQFGKKNFIKYGKNNIEFIRTKSEGEVDFFSSKQSKDYVLHFNICKLEDNTTVRVFFGDEHIDIDKTQIGFNDKDYQPLEIYQEIIATDKNPIEVTITKTNKKAHVKLLYSKKQLNGNSGSTFDVKKSNLKLGFFSRINDKKVAVVISDIVTRPSS